MRSVRHSIRAERHRARNCTPSSSSPRNRIACRGPFSRFRDPAVDFRVAPPARPSARQRDQQEPNRSRQDTPPHGSAALSSPSRRSAEALVSHLRLGDPNAVHVASRKARSLTVTSRIATKNCAVDHAGVQGSGRQVRRSQCALISRRREADSEWIVARARPTEADVTGAASACFRISKCVVTIRMISLKWTAVAACLSERKSQAAATATRHRQ
jgi:hypothetical protein